MLNQLLTTPPARAARTEAAPTTPPGGQDTFGQVLARQIEGKQGTTTPPQNANTANAAQGNNANTAETKGSAVTSHRDQTAKQNPLSAMLLGKQNLAAAKSVANSVATPDTTITPDMTSSPLLPGKPNLKVTAATDTRKSTSKDQATAPDAATTPLLVNPQIQLIPASSAKINLPVHQTGSNVVSTSDKSAAKSTTEALAGKMDSNILSGAKNPLGNESFKLLESVPPVPTPEAPVTAQAAQPNLQPGATATISAPLGSNAWPEEFSQKINWISTQQNQTAELHLNPPDLGPMSVTISISDNQATAQFSSPHSSVREAIENALPKLRESMADNGITLGNTTVSDQTPRDSGANNFMNQRNGGRAETENISSTESASIAVPEATTRRHTGMVDTFA